MKNLKNIFITAFGIPALILMALVAAPTPVQAIGLVSIVPDSCYERVTVDGNGKVTVKCGWNELMQMGQNVMTDAIYLAAMAAVISITYAGYLLMSSGGDSGAVKKGKEILWKVVVGIFFTLAAWLLVNTILKFLQVKDGFSLLSK